MRHGSIEVQTYEKNEKFFLQVVNDCREAVRLLYFQTLKQLSDAGRIEWQPYKTPTQYLYEVRLPAFRQLTNHFLQVRYGNFEATEELFRTMRALQEEIEEGGVS